MQGEERKPSHEDAIAAWLDAGAPKFFKFSGESYSWSCFTDELGFCGCGDPGIAAERLRDILTKIARKDIEPVPYGSEVGVDEQSDPGLYWLLWYWIDEKEWIEHGTNVRGSWITPKGERAIRILDAMIRIEAAE